MTTPFPGLHIYVLHPCHRSQDEWQGHHSSLAGSGECCRPAGNKGCVKESKRGGIDCLHWGMFSPFTAAVNEIVFNQLCFD